MLHESSPPKCFQEPNLPDSSGELEAKKDVFISSQPRSSALVVVSPPFLLLAGVLIMQSAGCKFAKMPSPIHLVQDRCHAS